MCNMTSALLWTGYLSSNLSFPRHSLPCPSSFPAQSLVIPCPVHGPLLTWYCAHMLCPSHPPHHKKQQCIDYLSDTCRRYIDLHSSRAVSDQLDATKVPSWCDITLELSWSVSDRCGRRRSGMRRQKIQALPSSLRGWFMLFLHTIARPLFLNQKRNWLLVPAFMNPFCDAWHSTFLFFWRHLVLLFTIKHD